jgi:hypothetical protein
MAIDYKYKDMKTLKQIHKKHKIKRQRKTTVQENKPFQAVPPSISISQQDTFS